MLNFETKNVFRKISNFQNKDKTSKKIKEVLTLSLSILWETDYILKVVYGLINVIWMLTSDGLL